MAEMVKILEGREIRRIPLVKKAMDNKYFLQPWMS